MGPLAKRIAMLPVALVVAAAWIAFDARKVLPGGRAAGGAGLPAGGWVPQRVLGPRDSAPGPGPVHRAVLGPSSARPGVPRRAAGATVKFPRKLVVVQQAPPRRGWVVMLEQDGQRGQGRALA
jgi:hypothetical protein